MLSVPGADEMRSGIRVRCNPPDNDSRFVVDMVECHGDCCEDVRLLHGDPWPMGYTRFKEIREATYHLLPLKSSPSL